MPNHNNSLDYLLVQIIRLFHLRSYTLFTQIGLHSGQPRVLFHLFKRDGCFQRELSRELMIKPATLTPILQRMEQLGLVERRADARDQRLSRVYLTARGREIRTGVMQVLQKREEELLQGFTPEERELLRRFLIRMRDNLAKACAEDTPRRDGPPPFAR